ncbi:TniQ family protein [Mameliella alba]|nr:TniQ family protein [Mameliella alba]MBY6167898.1 TniQ family protein [Mameliella alba]MBY6172919.1 TniQ family protein [Mameliella alba]
MTPERDESLLGFLKRVSDSEGYPEVGGFLTSVGQPYGRAMIENAESLSRALDLDFGVLEPLLPSSRASDPALDWRFHRLHSDPVCPACLSEGLPRRKEWRHALVSACAVHGIELIGSCPACGTELSVNGGSHLHCLCGALYSQAPKNSANHGEVQFSRVIAGLPAHLAGVALQGGDDRTAARTVWFLASSMHARRTGKTGKNSLPRTVADTRVLLDAIEPLLVDWPKAFDLHVLSRWNDTGAEGQTAAMRLGSWYQGLLKQSGLVAAALQERCLHIAAVVCGDPYKLHALDGEPEWVSAAEGARSLGIRAERLVEAVRLGVVSGRQSRSGIGHKHTVVARSEIDKISEVRSTTLDKKQARSFLGISRKQLDFFLDAGIICSNADAMRHPCVDGSISLRELENLVACVRHAVRGSSDNEEPLVALREINLRKTTDRTALLSFFKEVSTGKIRPVRFDPGVALGGAQFARKEVLRTLKTRGASISMTAGDVAQATGWKSECVAHWCEMGFLTATKSRVAGTKAWLIEARDLAEFQSRFLVVADFASRCATTSPTILRRLSAAGIKTVGAKISGKSSRGHLIPVEALGGLLTRPDDQAQPDTSGETSNQVSTKQ